MLAKEQQKEKKKEEAKETLALHFFFYPHCLWVTVHLYELAGYKIGGGRFHNKTRH